jgi:hypothetical protein
MIREFSEVHSDGFNILILIVCGALLLADRLANRDEFHYWAFMFVVWSWLLAIYSLFQFNSTNLKIGCWSFSAGCWQAIRLIVLD